MSIIGFFEDDGGREKAGYPGVRDDCLVRAIAIATDTPYRKAYRFVSNEMKARGFSFDGRRFKNSKSRTTNPRTAQYQVIQKAGFEKVRQRQRAKKLTYTEADKKYGPRIIVCTTDHVAAIVKGTLRDEHDGRTYTFCALHGFRCEGECPGIQRQERKASSIFSFKGGKI